MASSPPPNHRQLVFIVEGTAGLGQHWNALRSEYIDKITRVFHGADNPNQKSSGLQVEMALVVFYSHGSRSGCLFQQTGWTTNLDIFMHWLSCIDFSGGGFGEAAIAEGLAEALLMCCPTPVSSPATQVIDRQKHCILVAASNPNKLPTPLPRPPIQTGTASETLVEHWWLADADAVAKAFPQCLVSLSILCPRELQSLKSIFNGAKRNPRDTPFEFQKNPHHMVMLAEGFMEARAALSRAVNSALPTSSVTSATMPKIEFGSAPVTGQLPAVTARAPASTTGGMVAARTTVANGLMPSTTVKMELSSVQSMASASGMPTHASAAPIQSSVIHNSSTTSLSGPDPVVQSNLNTDTSVGQEFKPNLSSTVQPLRAVTGSNNSAVNLRQVMSTSTLGEPNNNTLGVPVQQLAGPMQVPSIISSSTGSAALSTTQSSIPGLGISSNTMGLGSGIGVGQGGVNNVGMAGFSGTASLVGNPVLGALQPAAPANGSVPGAQGGLGLGQGGLTGANQMNQGGGGGLHNVLAGLGPVNVSANGGTMMPTPGLPQGMQPHSVPTNTVPSPLQVQPTVATPPQQQQGAQPRYVRFWEGSLEGTRQGKAVSICKLDGYRLGTSRENLAADWPSTMQICRLIAQDHMHSKNYQGKAEILVFRPVTSHNFLGQLAEKKLCAVIQLPSQTLLLACSEKQGRMIGMLFPGEMVVFKPQIPSQPQLPSQPQASQNSNNGLGQSNGLGQTFSQSQLQGQTRPQLMQPGQLSGQPPSGFLQ